MLIFGKRFFLSEIAILLSLEFIGQVMPIIHNHEEKVGHAHPT
jgi:hypothetical protein